MILQELTGWVRWLAEFWLLFFAIAFAGNAARRWEWRKMLDGEDRLKAADKFGVYFALSVFFFVTYFLEVYKCRAS